MQRSSAVRIAAVTAASLLTGPFLLGALDRSAALARSEPAIGRAAATTPDGRRWRAEQLLGERNYAGAAAQARAVLADVPLDRAALRILMMAEQAQGRDEVAGELAIDASFVSRRDPYVQLYMYGLAARSGDMAEAARRADALSRIEDFRSDGFAALTALLAEPGGISAVAERLSLAPFWRRAYLGQVSPTIPGAAGQVLALADSLEHTGAALASDERALLWSRLVQSGQGRAAWQNWRDRRIARGGEAEGDPDFRNVRVALRTRAADPFGWSIPPDSSVRPVSDTDAQGRRALVVEHEGDRAPMFVSRQLWAEPGRYVLTYRATGERDELARLHPELWCASRLPVKATPIRAAAGTDVAGVSAEVPQGCGMLRVGFTLEAGDTGTAMVSAIRGVSFSPAS